MEPGHRAFSLVDVVPDVGERVSALTYHGDVVYAGTAGGRVLAYRVSGGAGGGGGGGGAGSRAAYVAERVAVAEVGSGKAASRGGSSREAAGGGGGGGGGAAVTQLEAVPDTGLLLVLCEGGLCALELGSLARRPGAAGVLDARGVVTFALNVRGAAARHRLCVAVAAGARRRLRLFEWAEDRYIFLKELDLPDSPRALAYVGGRLFLGYSREYNILYDETGDVQDLFAAAALSRDTRPLVKYLPGDMLLIVTAEDLGVVVTAAGEPAPVPNPRFGHHPLALAYCYPYLVSVSETSARMEIHSARSSSGRLGGGGKDEVVQAIDIPLGAVALVDGRAGYNFRTVLDYSDTARGRNPVYVAFGSPGRIMRLQPVPVDAQVEEMLTKLQVAAAEELLVNTAPDAGVLARKLARLRIDAGRVLFFSLDFEAAFAQLALSAIDPREVLALFPALALSAAGAAAATAPAPPLGSAPMATLAAAFRYPARYFHPALCASVADGSRAPRDAVSTIADASNATVAAAAAVVAADAAGGDFLAPAAGGAAAAGLEPGIVAAASDIDALIAAQLAAYADRARRADVARAELAPHSPPPPRAPANAAERLAACYEALLKFLRGRRAALLRHVRGGGGGGGGGRALAAAAAAAAAPGNASGGRVADDVAATLVATSAYDPSTLSDDDIDALFLALDTALLKLFHATRRWATLDRFAFRSPAVDMPDAVAFLRAVGKHHTVALLYQGRAMVREALIGWRELGTSSVLEYRESLGGGGGRARRSSSGGGELRRGSEAAGSRPRTDSLSSDDDDTAAAGDADGSGDHAWLPPSLRVRAAAGARGGAADEAGRYLGIEDSVEVLRREGDAALVFEFAEWLLLRSPAAALAVFTDGLRPVPFPHDTVLSYLRGPRFAELARQQPGAAPARLYLEYLVYSLGRTEARYHTQLACEYIACVLALRVDGGSGGAGSGAAALDREARLSGTCAERPPPGSEGGMLGELRARLVGLLQDSCYYDAERLQAAIDSAPLFEERVLLHARRREHARAMTLLVHSLGDHAHAVRYCAMLSRRLFGDGGGATGGGGGDDGGGNSSGGGGGGGGGGGDDAFPILLQLYLEADAKECERRAASSSAAATAATAIGGGVPSVFLQRALDILTHFGDYINPLALARILPGHITLASMLEYWSCALPASLHRSREATLNRHLHRHMHLTVQAELVRMEQRHVTISRHSFCAICDKRIDDSVFAALADGAVLHYGCLRELSNTQGAALSRVDANYGARRLGLIAPAPPPPLPASPALGSGGGAAPPPPAVRDAAVEVFPLYTANLPPAAASFRRARAELAAAGGSALSAPLSRGAVSAEAAAAAATAALHAAAAAASSLADTEAPVPSTALANRPLAQFVTTKVLRAGGGAAPAIVAAAPGFSPPAPGPATLPPRADTRQQQLPSQTQRQQQLNSNSPAPTVRIDALAFEEGHFGGRASGGTSSAALSRALTGGRGRRES